MGLLKNAPFWARRINRLDRYAPTRGEVMNKIDAIAVLRVACESLTDVVEDPEFESDCADIERLGIESISQRDSFGDLRQFIDAFREAETDVLMRSGVDMDVTIRVLEDVDRLLGQLSRDDLKDLASKIRQMRAVACEAQKDREPDGSMARDAKNAVFGVSVMVIDYVAVNAVPPGLGAIIGNSISYGALKARPLIQRIRRRF